jgi:hypothetical protein
MLNGYLSLAAYFDSRRALIILPTDGAVKVW